MRTITAMTLALCLLACGDAPSKEAVDTPPQDTEAPASDNAAVEAQAAVQKTLRVEYYEINKK